MVNSGREAELS